MPSVGNRSHINRSSKSNAILTALWNKFKARLIARGFSQTAAIDFYETFAPTMRFESLRILFAFCVRHGILIEQIDVDNAYLNTLLKR